MMNCIMCALIKNIHNCDIWKIRTEYRRTSSCWLRIHRTSSTFSPPLLTPPIVTTITIFTKLRDSRIKEICRKTTNKKEAIETLKSSGMTRKKIKQNKILYPYLFCAFASDFFSLTSVSFDTIYFEEKCII